MAGYEQANGTRLLDYFDLHFYPQAEGISLTGVGDANNQALRLRSTRSMWDPTYTSESWIGDTVQLIPRMRAWVADNYPGTKLSISEYNWGALDHINGALAQADLLGIFGREQLDTATLWGPPHSDDPGAYAFRMYLNYDGQGSGFGNRRRQANSTDQDTVAIYSALRSSDNALTIMLINKTGSNQTSSLQLSNASIGGQASRFQYAASNTSTISNETAITLQNGSNSISLPANSITLLVIPALDQANCRRLHINHVTGWSWQIEAVNGDAGTFSNLNPNQDHHLTPMPVAND